MKILLIDSPTYASSVVLKPYLSALDAEISVVTYSDSLDVTSYGKHDELLIIMLYIDSNDAVKKFISNLLTQQYVVIYNLSNAFASSGVDPSYTMKFFKSTGTSQQLSATTITTIENELLVQSNALSANTQLKTTDDGSVYVTKRVLADADSSYVNLANFSDDSTQTALGYFPAGSTVNGLNITGCMIFFGALTWKPGGKLKEIISDLYTLVKTKGAKAKYRISGTVGNSKQEPIIRKLRAYQKSSGNLMAETMSATDGTYKLDLSTSDPVYVVCLHDSTDSNNSQIQDDIIPILVE